MALQGSGLLVSDYPGNVRLFPSLANGQNAGSVSPAQNYGIADPEDITRANGQLYMARRLTGDIVKLNSDGTLNEVTYTGIRGLPSVLICPNPTNGHIYVSTGLCSGRRRDSTCVRRVALSLY